MTTRQYTIKYLFNGNSEEVFLRFSQLASLLVSGV